MKTKNIFKNKIMMLFFLVPFLAVAQTPFTANDEPALKLDLPLFDLPYQVDAMHTVGHGFFSSYANPSMEQSLSLTADLYSSFHFGVKKAFDRWDLNVTFGWWNLKDIILDSGLTLVDSLLLGYAPGGNGWLHEEYHRAVMTRYRVNSFNEMNTFPLGEKIIPVRSVTDEDLIRFKSESPADFVRMHAAGIEGGYALIDRTQRNSFFYNQNLGLYILNLSSTINSHAYIIASGNPNENDSKSKTLNEKENSVSSRDFTGFDMAAWAYDLFRPNEPYTARGPHPSGTGIDRYITTDKLTSNELNYLRAQRYWHIFNYVSPMLIGINRIPIGDTGYYGNFAFRHLLTSFGTDVALKVYLKKDTLNMAFVLHNYGNYEHYFPAIEAELIDFPVTAGPLNLYVSPRVIIGLQPESQKFKTGYAEFFGLAGCRVDFNISKYFLPYFEVTAKTNGWVAGNVFLKKNISINMGLSARF